MLVIKENCIDLPSGIWNLAHPFLKQFIAILTGVYDTEISTHVYNKQCHLGNFINYDYCDKLLEKHLQNCNKCKHDNFNEECQIQINRDEMKNLQWIDGIDKLKNIKLPVDFKDIEEFYDFGCNDLDNHVKSYNQMSVIYDQHLNKYVLSSGICTFNMKSLVDSDTLDIEDEISLSRCTSTWTATLKHKGELVYDKKSCNDFGLKFQFNSKIKTPLYDHSAIDFKENDESDDSDDSDDSDESDDSDDSDWIMSNQIRKILGWELVENKEYFLVLYENEDISKWISKSTLLTENLNENHLKQISKLSKQGKKISNKKSKTWFLREWGTEILSDSVRYKFFALRYLAHLCTCIGWCGTGGFQWNDYVHKWFSKKHDEFANYHSNYSGLKDVHECLNDCLTEAANIGHYVIQKMTLGKLYDCTCDQQLDTCNTMVVNKAPSMWPKQQNFQVKLYPHSNNTKQTYIKSINTIYHNCYNNSGSQLCFHLDNTKIFGVVMCYRRRSSSAYFANLILLNQNYQIGMALVYLPSEINVLPAYSLSLPRLIKHATGNNETKRFQQHRCRTLIFRHSITARMHQSVMQHQIQKLFDNNWSNSLFYYVLMQKMCNKGDKNEFMKYFKHHAKHYTNPHLQTNVSIIDVVKLKKLFKENAKLITENASNEMQISNNFNNYIEITNMGIVAASQRQEIVRHLNMFYNNCTTNGDLNKNINVYTGDGDFTDTTMCANWLIKHPFEPIKWNWKLSLKQKNQSPWNKLFKDVSFDNLCNFNSDIGMSM